MFSRFAFTHAQTGSFIRLQADLQNKYRGYNYVLFPSPATPQRKSDSKMDGNTLSVYCIFNVLEWTGIDFIVSSKTIRHKLRSEERSLHCYHRFYSMSRGILLFCVFLFLFPLLLLLVFWTNCAHLNLIWLLGVRSGPSGPCARLFASSHFPSVSCEFPLRFTSFLFALLFILRIQTVS